MATNMTSHEAFDSPGTSVSNDTAYQYLPVEYTREDREVIRRLAKEYMEYATLPVQKGTAALWGRVDGVESARPVV